MNTTQCHWLEDFVEMHTAKPVKVVNNPLYFTTNEIEVIEGKLDLYCDLCNNHIKKIAHLVYMSDGYINKAFCDECFKRTNYGKPQN